MSFAKNLSYLLTQQGRERAIVADLKNAKFIEQFNKKEKVRHTEQDTTCGYQHFYNGVRGQPTDRYE